MAQVVDCLGNLGKSQNSNPSTTHTHTHTHTQRMIKIYICMILCEVLHIEFFISTHGSGMRSKHVSPYSDSL
jgi:hypothetical protein